MQTTHVLGSLAACALAALATGGAAHAAVEGPYAPDASTLHLWHLDGDANDAVVGGVNLVAGNGATLDNPSVSGRFGSAAGGFTTGAAGGYVAPGAPANAAVGGTDNVNLALQDATTGAFTMEALVRLNTLSGSAAMHLVSGEGEGGVGGIADRAFQFRLNPIGFATGGSDNTRVRVEFNNFNAGGNTIIVNLPDTGPNAVNTADWFHVAVSYTGTPATPDNMTFYWTKLDPANTLAAVAGTGQQGAALTRDNNGATGGLTNTDFGLGNELRSTGGQGEPLLGLLDEVRISSIARAPGDFIVTPEPSALTLLAVPLGLLSRRRSR